MSVDIIDHRIIKNRRRRTVYLLPWFDLLNNSMTLPPVASKVDLYNEQTYKALNYRIRSYSEMAKAITLVPIPKLHKNKIYSSEEKKRRQIVESYKQWLSKGPGSPGSGSSAEASLNQITPLDTAFLENSQAPVSTNKKKLVSGGLGAGDPALKCEGGLCMAMSSRHWSEYVMRLTKVGVYIVNSHEAIRAYITLPVTSINCIRPMKRDETPVFFLNQLGCFQIETFSRVYYFMVKQLWLAQWIEVLHSFFDKLVYTSWNIPVEVAYKFPDPAEAYIARPPSLHLDKKKIFNYRRIIFNTKCVVDERFRGMTPNEVVETLLRSAHSLIQADAKAIAEATDWINFLNQITVLQVLNFSRLSERDKTAFLLNLYHLMVMHASLILGPPPSCKSLSVGYLSILKME